MNDKMKKFFDDVGEWIEDHEGIVAAVCAVTILIVFVLVLGFVATYEKLTILDVGEYTDGSYEVIYETQGLFGGTRVYEQEFYSMDGVNSFIELHE